MIIIVLFPIWAPPTLNISQNFQQQHGEQRAHEKKMEMKFDEEKWGEIKRTHLSHVDEQSNVEQEKATLRLASHSSALAFPLSQVL